MSRNASNTSTTGAVSPTNTTLKNSGMPLSTPPLSPSVTKLCHIVKRPDFEGYGFNLHSEKIKPGQYIGKVDANSPAESAGLKEGDRIIQVNDVAIGSETHKQVVQRIKAIACEVRLLLIDVDGNGRGQSVSKDNNKQHAAIVMPSSPIEKVPISVNNNSNNNSNMSNTTEEYQSTVQEMPGASANISSISMTSTKRMSNSSNQSQNGHTNGNRNSHNNNNNVDISMDVTDKAVNVAATAIASDIATTKSQSTIVGVSSSVIQERNGTAQQQQSTSKAKNNMTTTPPPPSAAIATLQTQQQQQQPQAFSNTGSSSNSNTTSISTTAATNRNATETSTLSGATTTTSNRNENGGNQFGSLKLPMTAAEMRAKLLTKKKYDPKNESVDLKKKFEIIQKL